MKILTAICALCVASIAAAQKPITITNTTNVNYTNQVVSIPWTKVLKCYPKMDTANFKLSVNGTEVPFQLEKLGGTAVQNLLAEVSVKPNSDVKLIIESGKHKAFKNKTFGRYVPERKDDFAWENDKIAFRMYGKALEGTSEDANGVDIWAKRSTDLVINDWYRTGDYHDDHGKGLDFYSVGLTLGAGDVAPLYQGKVVYPKHYRKFKILDNGPLRSTFVLEFDAFDVGGKTVTLSKTISLTAGERLNKVSVKVNFSGAETLPMVVGLVLSKQPGGKLYENANEGIISYWQTPTGQHGTIGVGALVKGSFEKVFEGEGQLLAKIVLNSNQPQTYYNGGAWDKQGEITNETEWLEYLQDFKQKLQSPLVVK